MLHNDVDEFITDENYFSQNLIKSRPELMTFVFAQDKGGEYSDVLGVVSSEVEDFAKDFNYDVFGVYLGTIPKLKSVTCIVPILCFVLQLLVTIVSQYFQRKNNPDMAKMSGSMNAMLYIMPLFSLWIAFSYPLGLGLYWCYSSLFALVQTIVLNKIYTPTHVAELVEKDIAKEKASGKSNFMQKMAEAQMVQAGKDPKEIKKAIYEDMGDSYEEPKKKSKVEMKEEQRKKLNEARKRMAEKYGDEYDDTQD
jgi:YidC/Oxa1 family membrane protein insertase